MFEHNALLRHTLRNLRIVGSEELPRVPEVALCPCLSFSNKNFFRIKSKYKEGHPLPPMSSTLPVHIRTNLFHNRSSASHFILFSIRQIEEIEICVRWTGWVHQIIVTICAVFISHRLEETKECKMFFRIFKSIG